MPWLRCTHPGCPNPRARRGLCADHERERKAGVDARRPDARARGYDGEHRAWRAAVLARDPVCVDPFRRHQGEQVQATVADHIVQITKGGGWTMENGQGLCESCHAVKRQQESMEARR